ncbi:MAG: hypothetical protein J3R72DRAFT_420003 [Linnemannia gamsii]|nr:MAG: hypothetical protein J3R72DRAFT_420003 [Linnemannia gamsii]
MAMSGPIRDGSASQASFKKNDSVNARNTHIYEATEEDITVARVYEKVVHAVLPDKHVQANLNVYNAHQQLTELSLEERSKGTIIQCSGTITMTILASGSRIKKHFAMEVKDARNVSKPAQEVEDLALVMNRSLSTSDDSSTMQGLSVEQIATLKQ